MLGQSTGLVEQIKSVAAFVPGEVAFTLLLGLAGVYLLLPQSRPRSRQERTIVVGVALLLAGISLAITNPVTPTGVAVYLLFVGAIIAGGLFLPARAYGAGVATAALVPAGRLLVHTDGFNPESFLFYAFAGIAIVAAALLITQRKPAYAALSFALVVLSTCGLFLLLAAPFLMAATIIIYAGAIIVTFLFVLMLAQQRGASDADDRSREPLLTTIAGFFLLATLLSLLARSYDTREIDATLGPHLDRVRSAADKQTAPEIDAALGGDLFFANFKKALDDYKSRVGVGRMPVGLEKLRTSMDNIPEPWDELLTTNDAAAMRAVLNGIIEEGTRARTASSSQPPPAAAPLSPFSGPPPNGPLKRDAAGNAPLPAANVEALGRSLFTDYLLAVELGGTLLLVATIGALAIATRHAERET